MQLLCDHDFGFDCVVVIVPVEEMGGVSSLDFEEFTDLFRGHKSRLRVPVIVTGKHGMLEVAHGIQTHLVKRTGILNPSDLESVQKGWLGCYWLNGRHVAMEEVLGVQTTLMLHRPEFNPDLWYNTGISNVHRFDPIPRYRT